MALLFCPPMAQILFFPQQAVFRRYKPARCCLRGGFIFYAEKRNEFMDKHAIRVLEYQKIVDQVAERAVSESGRELALGMQPVNDRKKIELWQDETAEAVSYLYGKGFSPVDFFYPIEGIVKRAMVGGTLSPAELLKVSKNLNAAGAAAGRIGDFGSRETHPNLCYLAECLTPHAAVAEEIDRCIESEETLTDYASPELAKVRRAMRIINDQIRDKLNSIIHSPAYSKYLQDPIITTRSDRFVVPVKMECRGQFPGIVHDQSGSGATLFIEPMAVVELNNKLRETELEEAKEIERILFRLSGDVERCGDDILENQKAMTRLDLVFAKAKYARQLLAVRPNIADTRIIKIKKGRHPLINPDVVVPIDVEVGGDYTSLVITGPNTGGKTVTLKTVGLFVLMAQSGLHIPANEGSTIGVFSDVLADIGDEQSIEQNLSTFSSHMTNIVHIMSGLNRSSLTLFDELGAGTDPAEGAALAMAILEQLCEKGIVTLATTHYSELKAYALTRAHMKNAAMEFDVETLRPTYRLLIGVPGKSNAFLISGKLGLPDSTIEKAREFMAQEDIHMEDVISSLEASQKKAIAEREEAGVELEAAKAERRKAEELRQKADKERNEEFERARQEARAVLTSAKEEAARIIRELNSLKQAGFGGTMDGKEFEKLRSELNAGLQNLDLSLAPPVKTKKSHKNSGALIKKGDYVHVTSIDKDGSVLSDPDNKGEVLVQVGIIQLSVKTELLEKTEDKAAVTYNLNEKRTLNLRTNSISPSLDLRGMDSQSAIAETDRYLDEVFLAGLNEVTIIHGKGTGVLRKLHLPVSEEPSPRGKVPSGYLRRGRERRVTIRNYKKNKKSCRAQ